MKPEIRCDEQLCSSLTDHNGTTLWREHVVPCCEWQDAFGNACAISTFFIANHTDDSYQPHYSQFLKHPLSQSELRVDCPDYTFAEDETR